MQSQHNEVVKSQDQNSLKSLFLVHGEHQAMKDFKNSLIHEGYENVIIPEKNMEYKI